MALLYSRLFTFASKPMDRVTAQFAISVLAIVCLSVLLVMKCVTEAAVIPIIAGIVGHSIGYSNAKKEHDDKPAI